MQTREKPLGLRSTSLVLFCFFVLSFVSLSVVYLFIFVAYSDVLFVFSSVLSRYVSLVVCFSTSLWVNGYLSLPVFFSYCNCLGFVCFFLFLFIYSLSVVCKYVCFPLRLPAFLTIHRPVCFHSLLIAETRTKFMITNGGREGTPGMKARQSAGVRQLYNRPRPRW